MSLIKRIRRIITGNINDILDKVVDPEKAVRQLIRDMEHGISELRKTAATVLASQKMTEKRLKKAIEISNDWQENAESCVREGRDDLAIRALNQKKMAEEKVALLEIQLKDETAHVNRLKGELSKIEDKIQEARIKRDTLIAKKRAIQRREKVIEATEKWLGSADSIINGFDAFEKVEEKFDTQTALLEAKEELKKISDGDNIDAAISRLKKDTDLNAELAELKNKMGR